jgi:hypothetical protein
MIGELLNNMFNEVTGKDPATKRSASAPFRIASGGHTIQLANVAQSTFAQGMSFDI